MKAKAIGVLLAMAMLLGLAALPASAASTGSHAGVFNGTALVSKSSTPPGTIGTANLCGQLTGPAGGPIGASCASTKGYNGHGNVTDPNLYVSNLTWKAAAAGSFIVTGNVGQTKGNKSDLLVAFVQVAPGSPTSCLDKETVGKVGHQAFTVAATYAVIANAGAHNQKKSK
jgi:hypothetical protein